MKKSMILVAAISVPLAFSISAGAQSKGAAPAVNSHAQSHSQAQNKAGVQSSGKSSSETDFAARIAADPRLSARLQAMLPANMTIQAAAAGFKNEGQFIAALHVSQNLQIPFDQLKAKMTGTDAVSLGAAIHQLRPAMTETQANDAAKKAEKTAKETEKASQN